jgi:hypothetical protein
MQLFSTVSRVISRGFALAGIGVLLNTATCPLKADSTDESIVLDSNGPAWTIVIDKQAADSVRTAAGDLQAYLKKAAGVETNIVSDAPAAPGRTIFLGNTAFAREHGIETEKLPSDGFRILTGPDWIIIAGKDYRGTPLHGTENPYQLNETYNPRLKISAFGDAGTQQGVYYFLRKFCGIRWYMPGPLGEVVPSTEKITVPKTDLQDSPAFSYRYPYFCFFSSSDDNALWYRRAGFGAEFPVAIQHSFQLFLKYKDAHPEYFALIDGQRDFTTLSSLMGPGNLNLSDPGLIRQAIADINEFFDKNPHERFFSLVPPDGMRRISEDPVSQAQIDDSQGPGGKFSNYVWGFINTVAKGVYEKHPDKFIGGIAYEHYSLPPTNIDKMSPNVVVMICKPLRRSLPNAEQEAATRKRIEAWREKVDILYFWEYYCDMLFNAGWKGYPVLYPPADVQRDLQYLKGKARGEMIEAETWTNDQYSTPEKIVLNDPGLQHLRLYVTSQLLWNPDIDLKTMLGEYYRLFYGPAEAEMREFWETVEDAWRNKSSQDPMGVFQRDHLHKLLLCLNRAKEKTVAGSDYRARVELIEKEFTPATEKNARLETIRGGTVSVAPAKAQVVANGTLDEPAWKKVSLLNLIDTNYLPAKPATHVRLTWDEKALHISFMCFEPKMDSLRTRVKKAGKTPEAPVWDDDSVEIFLQPNGGDSTYHLIVNTDAAVYQTVRKPNADSLKLVPWAKNVKVAAGKEEKAWTTELSIPWASLGVANAKDGVKLRGNFYRNRYVTSEHQQSSWTPIISGQFYAPEEFGEITLSGQPETRKQIGDRK